MRRVTSAPGRAAGRRPPPGVPHQVAAPPEGHNHNGELLVQSYESGPPSLVENELHAVGGGRPSSTGLAAESGFHSLGHRTALEEPEKRRKRGG